MSEPPRIMAGTIAQTIRNQDNPIWLHLITQRERRVAMVLAAYGQTATTLSSIRDIISRMAPAVERHGVESFPHNTMMRALAEAMPEPRS